MSTTNWSAYRPVTDNEQVLFINLLGKSLGVRQALLVSTLSAEKGFTEHIFLYNHPDPEVHNLVSFYAKVEDKKETLLQYATAQLTEKMILKGVKLFDDLTDEDCSIKGFAPCLNGFEKDWYLNKMIVDEQAELKKYTRTEKEEEAYKGKSAEEKKEDPKNDEILHNSRRSFIYNLTSQATYFFDCKNQATIDKKTQQISNINSITSKGSFCCILKKGTEYFILTAAHNLQNVTNKSYKLIKDESNYVDLELIRNYGELTNSQKNENEELKKKEQPLKYFTYDAAILKVTTQKIIDTHFHKNRKEFDSFEDVPKDDKWRDAGLIGYKSKSKTIKISDKQKDGTASEFNIDAKNSGESGDSGGCVFNFTEQKKLHGVFNGSGPTGGLLYSKIPDISNYKLC